MSIRSAILAAGLLVVAAAGCSGGDADPEPAGGSRTGIDQYNLPPNRVAMQSYNPVSYFQQGGPRRGTTPFGVTLRGIEYRFNSPADMDAFKADPDKYEPACGGWCAYGMSQGRKDQPDPTAFKIVNGRLMLLAAGAAEKWNAEDQSLLVERADDNWRHFLQQGG